MFIKVTSSGPRRYVQLMESFRDEQGVSRQRVVATLGRLESVQAGGNDALIVCGHQRRPSERAAGTHDLV